MSHSFPTLTFHLPMQEAMSKTCIRELLKVLATEVCSLYLKLHLRYAFYTLIQIPNVLFILNSYQCLCFIFHAFIYAHIFPATSISCPFTHVSTFQVYPSCTHASCWHKNLTFPYTLQSMYKWVEILRPCINRVVFHSLNQKYQNNFLLILSYFNFRVQRHNS